MYSPLLRFAAQLAAFLAAQLAVIFASTVAAVFVHEAGHTLAALVCGFSIQSLRVGPWKIARTRERSWALSSRAKVEGAVRAVFRKVPGQRARWRCIVLVCGGPMANILMALLFWRFAFGSSILSIILGVFLLFSAAIGLMNLVPFRLEGVESDGAVLLSLLANSAAKDELVFRASLRARLEAVETLRSSDPRAAVIKLEELIREVRSLAARPNTRDLVKLVPRFEKMIERCNGDDDAAAQADADPPKEPSSPGQE